MYWKNLILLHWKYLFSITLINIIWCCFSVGSPILLCSACSAVSTLQILRLFNSSEIQKVILKLLLLRLGCLLDILFNGGHLLIFSQFETWKCNFKQKTSFFMSKSWDWSKFKNYQLTRSHQRACNSKVKKKYCQGLRQP